MRGAAQSRENGCTLLSALFEAIGSARNGLRRKRRFGVEFRIVRNALDLDPKTFHRRLANHAIRTCLLVGYQRLAGKSLLCHDANLQGSVVTHLDDNGDHSVIGKIRVVQSVARLVDALVVPSSYEFEVRTDEVELGVRNPRQDEVFYSFSAVSVRLQFCAADCFRLRRVWPLVDSALEAPFCEVTFLSDARDCRSRMFS